ncbi:MAG TPA: FAD-binding oxidoreductase [Candidatus Sulfotelmatobacter sp.]|nr:FAD-binding oxidoreductase [Candidatus Sulfotelmatobacter sp.]
MAANDKSRTTDIIIVGAGVMGASLAFQLMQRKAGRVLVIDKDHVGSGSSGRSSALIRMHYTHPGEVALAVKSLEIFRNWEEIIGEPSDFRKVGFVRIVPASEAENLKRNIAMQQSLGVNTRVIDRRELKEFEPDWFVDDVEVAAYEPESGYGDGVNVANGFLARARDCGTTYLSKTAVNKVLVENDRVLGVATSQGNIHAPIVVLATGIWTTKLTDPLSLNVPIRTEYHEVAILKSPAGMKPHGAACVDSITKSYFRSDGPDKTLVGTMFAEQAADPDNFPQRATQESLSEICEMACRRIPALRNAELMRGITGVYDMTPDSRAMLGPLPEIPGLYLVTGFSGMGFKISPAVGIGMAELILEGSAHTVDISEFRATRFREGKPIRPKYEYASASPGPGVEHTNAH